MKQTPQELFRSYQPELGDSDRYIEELSKELDTVEMIHRIYEENARRSRTTVLIAALLGAFFGGLAIAIVLLCPSSYLDFSIKLGTKTLDFIINYSVLLLPLSALVTIYLVVFQPSFGQSESSSR